MLGQVLSAGIGYVAGLLPSADIVASAVAKGTDPRKHGSGNPGAVNVANLLGKRAGAAVFGLDMGKALVASGVGGAIAGPAGANLAGSAAVLGHCFPAHRGFRGGKGVAASFGQMLGTFPAYLPVDIALGAAAARTDFWKQRPVASVGATCGLWVALAALWVRRDLPNLWGPAPTISMPLGAAVSGAAIVYRFAVEAKQPPPASSSS